MALARRVICFGTFDLLHPGHIFFLRRAASFGRELYVVLARDERRKKISGSLPIHSLRERIAMVGSLRMVHTALQGHATDMLWHVKRLKPSVIVLGHDQTVGVAELQLWLAAHAPRTRVVRLKPFKRARYATTSIKQRLCANV